MWIYRLDTSIETFKHRGVGLAKMRIGCNENQLLTHRLGEMNGQLKSPSIENK